jgi:hypothetical protein
METQDNFYLTDEALNHLDLINIEFVKTNLDLVDFTKNYTVKKIKDISGKSPIANDYTVMPYFRTPTLIVMQGETFNPKNVMLALYFYTSWMYFRTSPVKNVTKKGKNILVETENSVYELMEE